jgi:type IV pilus assembly protein PilM
MREFVPRTASERQPMSEGKHLVGVDIGSTSVKICQLVDSRKGPVLTRLGYAPIAPQVIVDGQVMDAAAVIEAIQSIYRQQKISEKQCALSISGQSVIIRKITVPMMTAAELEEQIHWEAEQHIPFDIKDVEVDYQVLRRRPESSQMDLLLVAAKREQIADYLQLARNAKLRPVVCDIDAFTVQNLFEHTRGLPPDRTIALLTVGGSLCSLNIVSNGVSAFTREIASGGHLITEEIQKAMSVPHDQAEAYKCGGMATPDDRGAVVPRQVVQIIETACDGIAAEIQRSLDFFMATSGESEIGRIFVTGGSSALPQLAQAIERRSRVQVEVWSPLERIQVDPKRVDRSLLESRSGQLAVALGLALRRQREQRS